MQKSWRQKAKIRLLVDKCHIKDWTSEKEGQFRQFILREFHLDQDDLRVAITLLGRERIYVEFSVVCFVDSVSALSIAKALEYKFFNLKIYEHKVSFEKNK